MIAVDIGDTHIKIAELESTDKQLRLVQSFIQVIDSPVLDQNQLLDADRLAEYLRPAFAKMRSRDVVISFSCMATVANEYTIPYEKNDLKRLAMVKSKVFQNLSPEEYLVDYRLGAVLAGEQAPMCSVTAYIVPRSIVAGAYQCIFKLGKRPRGFEVAQNSAFDFAKRLITQKSFIIVHVSVKKLTAHLINFPHDVITRVVELNQPQEESFTGLFGGDLSAETIAAPEVSLAEELWSMVSKLTQYQAIKYPGTTLESIYLTGSATTPEHAQLLTQNSDIPTRILGRDWMPIRTSAEQEGNTVSLFYNLGAAMSTGEINFFQVLEQESRRKVNKGARTVRLVFLLTILVQLIFFAILIGVRQREQGRVASLQDFMTSPEVLQLVTEDAGHRSRIIADERALLQIADLQSKIDAEMGFSTDIFATVESVRPPNVTLLSFSYQAGVLNIVCNTENDNPPADYAKALEGTGRFSDIDYRGFSQGDGKVSFAITCTLGKEVTP